MQSETGSKGSVTNSVEHKIFLEYQDVPLTPAQKNTDLLRTTQECLHSTTRINFKGQSYIRLEDLRRVLSAKLIADLLEDDGEQPKCSLTTRQDGYIGVVDEVRSKALRLLGLCILANVPLGTFMDLLKYGTSDQDLPLDDRLLPSWVTAPSRGSLLVLQNEFLPYSFGNIDSHGSVPAGIPLPILFNDLQDRVGYGSFSEVYKVKVDSEAKPFCEQRHSFALKRFRRSTDSHVIFSNERSMLEELYKQPHDHVVGRLATFTDQHTSYIIFPLARCNLRTFFSQVTAPRLERDFVLWFFTQVHGLADAVLHFNSLGSTPASESLKPGQTSAPARSAIHGDIKPENILVFEADNGSPFGVFKLSDFGSSRTLDNTTTLDPTEAQLLRGTQAYEAPDFMNPSELSCGVDVWSLGCVFLELICWIFFPQGSEDVGFMTLRSAETVSKSGSFWQISDGGEVNIKWAVGRRLVDLEKKFGGRLAFERLCNAVWFLINVALDRRYTAAKLVKEVEFLRRELDTELAEDPNCYLEPKRYVRSPNAVKKPRHPIWAKMARIQKEAEARRMHEMQSLPQSWTNSTPSQ